MENKVYLTRTLINNMNDGDFKKFTFKGIEFKVELVETTSRGRELVIVSEDRKVKIYSHVNEKVNNILEDLRVAILDKRLN